MNFKKKKYNLKSASKICDIGWNFPKIFKKNFSLKQAKKIVTQLSVTNSEQTGEINIKTFRRNFSCIPNVCCLLDDTLEVAKISFFASILLKKATKSRKNSILINEKMVFFKRWTETAELHCEEWKKVGKKLPICEQAQL